MIGKGVLVTFLCLLVVVSASAFQFEDYPWGAQPAQLEKLLTSRGKKLIPSNRDTVLMYHDVILDEECRIELLFTSLTKELSSVIIRWQNTYVGEDIKQLLTTKYGAPSQPNVYVDEYYWEGSSEYDVMDLEYGYAGVTLSYYGGMFYQKYEEQSKELIKQEQGRF